MTKIKFTDQSPELVIPVGASSLEQGPKDVQVSVHPEAQRKTLQFLGRSHLEQGGLLLGRIWSRPSSPNILALIDVIEAVPSQTSSSTAYSLKMHSNLWTQAHESLGRMNLSLAPGEQALRIVGWFHSHPHMGAFFSDTDIETQRAFFTQVYSLGWVIDPYSSDHHRHEAFFLGPECSPIERAGLPDTNP